MLNQLIVGVDGMIGSALFRFQKALSPKLQVWGTSRQANRIDSKVLSLDLEKSALLPDTFVWDTVIICAAISTFAACSAHPDRARKVNIQSVLQIAEQVKAQGGHLLFLSTSSVFSGDHPLPHEDTLPSPQTEYGKLKYEAETRLLELTNAEVGILRLTKVINENWSMAENWLSHLRENKCIHPAMDLPCAPIPLRVVIEVVSKLAESRSTGIWHLSPFDELSYGEMAKLMVEQWGEDAELVRPKTLLELGVSLEHAPQHAALNSQKLQEHLNIPIPTCREVVKATALQIQSTKPR